jgi:hypothetical protein
VNLPGPAANPSAVVTYLTRDGAPIVRFLHASTDFPSKASSADCTALAATRLEPIGGPAALGDVALRIPDGATKEAAINHIHAVSHYLSVCSSDGSLAPAAEQVHFTSTVFARILKRTGVQ